MNRWNVKTCASYRWSTIPNLPHHTNYPCYDTFLNGMHECYQWIFRGTQGNNSAPVCSPFSRFLTTSLRPTMTHTCLPQPLINEHPKSCDSNCQHITGSAYLARRATSASYADNGDSEPMTAASSFYGVNIFLGYKRVAVFASVWISSGCQA